MEEIGLLMQGFAVALQPDNLLLMLLGVSLGVLIGVLPGLGGANGIAILLPLTFAMPPVSAIIMLSCIYWGALFGGAITSILFNIPGEPWSVATTFDGYPMAQQGRAGEALTAAFTASFVGAFIAVVLLTFLAPLVAGFALRFGPPEFFAVMFLSFACFIGLGRGSPLKTLGRDDARLPARRRRHGHRDRPAPHDLRLARDDPRLRLPGRGDRPVRHLARSCPPSRTGSASAARRRDRPQGGAPHLGRAAAPLGHRAPLGADRLLDGHHAGRRHPGLLHELRRRPPHVPPRQGLRHRPDRGRGRARDGGARRRHQRPPADARARRARLTDRRGAARRPHHVGPPARADALRRAEGIRLGPDRLHVSRQHRRAAGGAGGGALVRGDPPRALRRSSRRSSWWSAPSAPSPSPTPSSTSC